MKFVTENMERVQVIGAEKSKIRDLVMDVMQEKLQAQFKEMGGPGGQPAKST